MKCQTCGKEVNKLHKVVYYTEQENKVEKEVCKQCYDIFLKKQKTFMFTCSKCESLFLKRNKNTKEPNYVDCLDAVFCNKCYFEETIDEGVDICPFMADIINGVNCSKAQLKILEEKGFVVYGEYSIKKKSQIINVSNTVVYLSEEKMVKVLVDFTDFDKSSGLYTSLVIWIDSPDKVEDCDEVL